MLSSATEKQELERKWNSAASVGRETSVFHHLQGELVVPVMTGLRALAIAGSAVLAFCIRAGI